MGLGLVTIKPSATPHFPRLPPSDQLERRDDGQGTCLFSSDSGNEVFLLPQARAHLIEVSLHAKMTESQNKSSQR